MVSGPALWPMDIRPNVPKYELRHNPNAGRTVEQLAAALAALVQKVRDAGGDVTMPVPVVADHWCPLDGVYLVDMGGFDPWSPPPPFRFRNGEP